MTSVGVNVSGVLTMAGVIAVVAMQVPTFQSVVMMSLINW